MSTSYSAGTFGASTDGLAGNSENEKNNAHRQLISGVLNQESQKKDENLLPQQPTINTWVIQGPGGSREEEIQLHSDEYDARLDEEYNHEAA